MRLTARFQLDPYELFADERGHTAEFVFRALCYGGSSIESNKRMSHRRPTVGLDENRAVQQRWVGRV